MFATAVSLLITFLSLQVSRSQKCKATVFGTPGDKHMGTMTACKGRGETPYLFDPDIVGIAHRNLPCGKKLIVVLPRTRRWALAEVVDRGPYGAIMDDGTWGKKIRSSDEGKWRGCVDMTPSLSEALDHDGWDDVEIRY